MTDCPHIHEQDTGLQTFRDHINEVTDGGRCGRNGRKVAGLISNLPPWSQSWLSFDGWQKWQKWQVFQKLFRLRSS